MNNLFTYLLELNIVLIILFVAYKIFFERDKNFFVRRIYLLGVIALPFILLLIPDAARMSVNRFAPISINLEGITVFGSAEVQEASGAISFGKVILLVYLTVLSLGLLKLLIQLTGISLAIVRSERITKNGTTILLNSSLHASSFFGYIFMNPTTLKNDSINHILEHEQSHKQEWHSIDRILAELFLLVNWFNPVVWMLRKSIIQNLEFLADSAVMNSGNNPMKYQLSIINQYIGSASISNQFSSQIKNRIIMLNKDYKLGSRWKLAMMLPLAVIAYFLVSCADKDIFTIDDNKIYYEVEEMPKFMDGEVAKEFRIFIAQNLRYPAEAAEHGVSGRIAISFIVRKDGMVEIPEPSEIAAIDGVSLDEVVVVTFKPIDDNTHPTEEKYIELLKNEAIRVVTASPQWEPGKVNGKPVNVMYTFPINFVLQ